MECKGRCDVILKMCKCFDHDGIQFNKRDGCGIQGTTLDVRLTILSINLQKGEDVTYGDVCRQGLHMCCGMKVKQKARQKRRGYCKAQ